MKFESTMHKFLSGIILVTALMVSFDLPAQITQPIVYERTHKDTDHNFIVVSMGDMGLALIRDTEKYEGTKKIWEAIFLDSALNETWATKMEIDQRMNILGNDYRNGNVYLIFEEPENSGRKVNLIELILSDSTVKQHQFKPEVTIQYTHFSILKSKAVFAGYIGKEPTILMYDLNQESTKVIPGTFLMKEELMDVRNNSNDTFNVLLTERSSKSIKKIIVRTYDSNGVQLIADVIAIDEDKSIIEAITSTLVRDELVVMGTWTYGSNKQAAGVFSVVIDPFNEQKVNYYDFAQLNHFLDYLRPKKAAKIKAKAEWRKSVDKQPEFRTYFYPIKIVENKEGFSLLGEVYDPPTGNNLRNSPYGYNPYYNPYPYSPYGFVPIPYRYSYGYPYGYPYGNNSGISETRMIHSSLIFFNGHGSLLSDQSLKFPEIKLVSKEQVSDFITLGGQTVMVCMQEKEVLAQITEPDGTVIRSEKILPALKNPNETAKPDTDDRAIRFWYGRFFYAYGYHKITNSAKHTRHVFYINKVRVD